MTRKQFGGARWKNEVISLVEPDEITREACGCSVNEKIDLDVVVKELVGPYDGAGRGERGNVSAAIGVRLSDDPLTPREEAQQVRMLDPADTS